MKKPVFLGTCTALVTPFYKNAVNYPLLERLIERQIEAGISAIVVCGTTGESPVLSDSEKITIFQRSVEFARGRCKIIAGTGSNSTEHAVALSIAAEQVGVDALLIVSPYYNKATAEGLIVHYSTIAASVSIPIIVYNVPSRTGVDIPVDVYRNLSAIPNIAGVKEASDNIVKIARIRVICPEDFYIWSGNDDKIVPTIALGGSGVISVLSNIEPQKTERMVQAALAQDYTTAGKMQIELLPLIDMLFKEVNPIPVKAAMRIIGYNCGECRLPLTPVSPDLEKALKRTLS